jgi:hypothetical protein
MKKYIPGLAILILIAFAVWACQSGFVSAMALNRAIDDAYNGRDPSPALYLCTISSFDNSTFRRGLDVDLLNTADRLYGSRHYADAMKFEMAYLSFVEREGKKDEATTICHMRVARSAAEAGFFDLAEGHLRKTLQGEKRSDQPDNPAHRANRILMVAELLQGAGQDARAEKLYREALALVPGSRLTHQATGNPRTYSDLVVPNGPRDLMLLQTRARADLGTLLCKHSERGNKEGQELLRQARTCFDEFNRLSGGGVMSPVADYRSDSGRSITTGAYERISMLLRE